MKCLRCGAPVESSIHATTSRIGEIRNAAHEADTGHDSTYTEGPWKLGEYYHEYGDLAVGPESCNVAYLQGAFDSPEAMANGHLIAAAPEMYAALKQFVIASEEGFEQWPIAIKMCNEAIRKAEEGA